MGEDLSRLRQKIAGVKKQRDHLEALIMGSGPVVSGSLIRRYTTCGKPGCQCKKGKKHGPFLYLSRTEGKSTKMVYVPKGKWVEVRTLSERYHKLRERRKKLGELNQSIYELLDELEARLEKSPKEVL